MTKTILLLATLVVSNLLSAQDLDGVWIATDDQVKKLATSNSHFDGAVLLDFDNGLIGNMANISNEKMIINRKKTKIKAAGLKGKFKIERLGPKQLVLKGAKGVSSSFKKLDLSHKIEIDPNDLNDYLIEQHCGVIQGVQGKFTDERFFKDSNEGSKLKRNQYINFTDRKNGYWYFRNIRDNTFLVFTVDDNSTENIFQVLSLRLKGFDVLQLQNSKRVSDLNLLETCL